MPSVERCMPRYLAQHVMLSTRSLFELVNGTGAATEEHASKNSRNSNSFGLDDLIEAEIDHVLAVVVDGEPAEWLRIKVEVYCVVVKRRVLVDFASLGDQRNVELQ
jgi:hypothetical protein